MCPKRALAQTRNRDTTRHDSDRAGGADAAHCEDERANGQHAHACIGRVRELAARVDLLAGVGVREEEEAVAGVEA